MIETLNAAALTWWQWMSAMFWQVSLLIVIIGVIDFFIRKQAWPQVRYALWFLVLLKLVIPPDFALPTGIFSAVPEFVNRQVTALVPDEDLTMTFSEGQAPDSYGNSESELSGGQTSKESLATKKSISRGLVWQVWVLFIWLAGIVVFAFILTLQILNLRRWHDEQVKRKTIPVWFNEMLLEIGSTLKLERLPAVVFSEKTAAPAIYGIFRPVLLLPNYYAEDLSKSELRYMVMHELTHLKRRDLIFHFFAMLLQVVYWFNPLLIWSNRRLKHVREICCDLSVAQILKEKTVEYRQVLVSAARRLLTESVSPALGLLGVFEEPYRIINRIQWLEKDMNYNKYFISLASIAVVTVIILLVFPMSPFRGASAQSEQSLSDTGEQPGYLPVTDGKYHYLKHVTTVKKMVMGVAVETRVTSEEELWLGNNKVVMIEEAVKVIVDLDENTYTHINTVAKTYVKATMPLAVDKLLSDELFKYFNTVSFNGTITKTGKTKNILGKPCEEYKYEAWNVRNNQRERQREWSIWTYTDPDVDFRPFYVGLDNRRNLQGGTDNIRKELKKLSGFQMVLDYSPNVGLFGEKTMSEVKLYERRTPPSDLFVIPDYYKRKEKFSANDF